MNRLIIVSFLVMIHTIMWGQNDTAAEVIDAPTTLHAGIYLTAEDFINDTPIEPRQIQTGLDSKEINFYHLLFKEPEVRYRSNGESLTVSSVRVWGYSDGKVVYVNKNLFRDFGDAPDKLLKYSFWDGWSNGYE